MARKKGKKGKKKSASQRRPAAKPSVKTPHEARAKTETKAKTKTRTKSDPAKPVKWTDWPAGTDRKSTAIAVAASALSGVLWFTACANFDIWIFAWFAAVPSLWVIMKAPTRRRAWIYGWITGIVANVGGFYWITELLVRFGHMPLPLAVLCLLLLGAYQATVFLWFALAARRIYNFTAERLGNPLPMALVAPIAMVTFEMIVPFIFPWYLAITQAWVVPVIQIAELTGPVGVTAMLMAVNGAIYDALVETRLRRRIVPVAGAAAFVGAALVFGFIRMGQIDDRRADAPEIKVGVVQGNIPFDEKGIDNPELARQQLYDLQRKSAELEEQGADLIMWTESSYPFVIPREAEGDFSWRSPARIRRDFTKPLILGAITLDGQDRDAYPYNSALMLDSNGTFQGRFDKIFLLMFGEYTPGTHTFGFLRDWLPRNAGHFARGEDIVTFPFEHEGEQYRLGPMICYEDILPDFGRKLGKHHPHLLVNITNDAWFGDTSEPWEHLALSVFRSVELRTDMVRAVNTGVSAFIDANGRVFASTYAVDPKKTPKPVDGLVAPVVLMEGGHTFYARFGDVFGYLCVLLGLGAWQLWPRIDARRRRKKEKAEA